MEQYKKPHELDEERISLLVDVILALHNQVKDVFHDGKFEINYSEEDLRAKLESILISYFVPYFGQMNCIDEVDQIAKVSYFIARDHVFSDGNKRTSVLVLRSFLIRFTEFNTFNASEDEIYNAILESYSIEDKDLALETYVKWVKSVIKSK